MKLEQSMSMCVYTLSVFRHISVILMARTTTAGVSGYAIRVLMHHLLPRRRCEAIVATAKESRPEIISVWLAWTRLAPGEVGH